MRQVFSSLWCPDGGVVLDPASGWICRRSIPGLRTLSVLHSGSRPECRLVAASQKSGLGVTKENCDVALVIVSPMSYFDCDVSAIGSDTVISEMRDRIEARRHVMK
jgi:hypothetical protein